MKLVIQDASCKSQENRPDRPDRTNRLENLVPELELCRQIPEGAFEDSVMVITQDGCVEIRKGSMLKYRPEIKKYPAPTLEEILEQFDILTFAFEKENSPTHEMDENRTISTSIGGLKDDREKNPFALPKYHFAVPRTATDALKLWLELNSKKGETR